MSESVAQEKPERIPPEDIFSLLSNETRISIIHALWQTENEQVTFSELRAQIGMTDSGQFNYHLGKLVGTFVQHDNGTYGLTYAGRKIIGAILDGTYTKRAEVEPFELDASCSDCGATLEASYGNDQLVVRCQCCEELLLQFSLPPGVLEGRPHEELAESSSHWIRAQLSFAVNGICSNCAGNIVHSITTEPDQHDCEVVLEYDCKRCKHHATSTVPLHFSYHPAVISFYDRHGIDITDGFLNSYVWSNNQCATILSEDPRRIEVAISLEGDELTLLIDGDLNVIERQ